MSICDEACGSCGPNTNPARTRAVRCFGHGPIRRLPQGPLRDVRAERVHRRGEGQRGIPALAREASIGSTASADVAGSLPRASGGHAGLLQYLLHDLFAANTFWELEPSESRRSRPQQAPGR